MIRLKIKRLENSFICSPKYKLVAQLDDRCIAAWISVMITTQITEWQGTAMYVLPNYKHLWISISAQWTLTTACFSEDCEENCTRSEEVSLNLNMCTDRTMDNVSGYLVSLCIPSDWTLPSITLLLIFQIQIFQHHNASHWYCHSTRITQVIFDVEYRIERAALADVR